MASGVPRAGALGGRVVVVDKPARDGLLSVLACGLAIGGLLWFGLVLLAAAGWIAFFMDFED